MKNFKNYTPHAIMLNNGTVYASEGVARVSSVYTDFDADGICGCTYGNITGLPAPQEGVVYIVSSIVLGAVKMMGRTDCVAPATGHPDRVRENGFIKSVPGFIR